MAGSLDLYQNDSRWKNDPLGFSTDSTIGLFGCLLTSLAMVANHFGYDETPASLNEKMKAAGAFQGPWVRAAGIASVCPRIKYAKGVDCSNQPAPMADLDAALAAGKPVIAEVDYSPDPGVQNHWIVMYAKQGDDYLVRDPWNNPAKNGTLIQRYGFNGAPDKIINYVIWIDEAGVAPPTAAPKAAAPPKPAAAPAQTPGRAAQSSSGTGLVVQAMIDALTLRSGPQITNNNVIKYLPVNAKLLVTEPAGGASSKIGLQNQWLKVKDIEGAEGYVAAWYVTAAQDPALGARPATTGEGAKSSAPSKLVVRTTTEGVVLRNAPRIANDTQIKLLPMNSELLVVEAGDAAAKIGAQGQWLKVKDIQGAEGYVAAWYVKKG